MMNFNTYRLLNESLGMYSLGVTPAQIMGIQSNLPGFGEAGLPPEIGAKKKKPPFGDEEPGDDVTPMGDAPVGDDMGGEDLGGEDVPPMGDDMGGEDLDTDGDMDVHAKIAELEAELEKLKAQVGDEDGLDDVDADLDHEDDLGDLGDEDHDGDAEGETGEDLDHDDEEGEEHKDKLFGKKTTPFMKKGMKEDCDGDKKKDGKLVDKGGKDGPVFMMKKCSDGKKVILGKAKKMDASDDSGMLPMKKGMKKHCSDGKMCKKCESKMKKETTGYERPQAIDNSEEAWLGSIRSQIAQTSVTQKFSDGMDKLKKEDLLLPPTNALEAVPEPKQEEQQPGDLGFTAEAVQDILARLARLEKVN